MVERSNLYPLDKGRKNLAQRIKEVCKTLPKGASPEEMLDLARRRIPEVVREIEADNDLSSQFLELAAERGSSNVETSLPGLDFHDNKRDMRGRYQGKFGLWESDQETDQ